MLYTDSDHITETTLASVDPELPEIATAEGISTASIIVEAWSRCAAQLLAYTDAFGDSAGLTETLWVPSGPRSRVFLSQIVASSPYADADSALESWLQYVALELFYTAAARRVSNDRYTERRDDYREDVRRAWGVLARLGLPAVTTPLPCPGAKHERNAGTWSADNLTAPNGGAVGSSVTYDVAITWTSATGVESAPSAIMPLVVAANKAIRVDIASLTPPTAAGASSLADGTLTLLAPASWSIYAGVTGGTLWRQVAQIPIATTAYTLTTQPAASGIRLGTGQQPERNIAFRNTLQRI